MELVSFAPETAPSLLLPEKEILLLPIGDIQYGTPGCDMDRLKRHIKWGESMRAKGHSVYYVGLGDYSDLISPSNRKLVKQMKINAYDSLKSMMDDAAMENLEVMKKVLKPTVGKWIGMVSGHHYWEFEDGMNTDFMLARYLETPYLGRCALIHLRFNQNKWTSTAKIWLHHGQGGGQTASAPINKVMRNAVPFWMAHLYLIGHYHSKSTQPIPWIDSVCDQDGKVRMIGTTRYIVSCGGFLGGYAAEGRNAAGVAIPNYIEEAMLSPNTLGAPVIFIRPVRKSGIPTIDLNVLV